MRTASAMPVESVATAIAVKARAVIKALIAARKSEIRAMMAYQPTLVMLRASNDSPDARARCRCLVDTAPVVIKAAANSISA